MAEVEDIEKEKDKLELQTFLSNWIKCGFDSEKAYCVTFGKTIVEKPEKENEITRDSAKSMGSRKLGMFMKVYPNEVLEARGMGESYWLEKLKEGCEATKTVSGIGDADEKSIEFVEVADYKTRREYHKALGKVLQIEKDKIEHSTPDGKPLLEKIIVEIIPKKDDHDQR